MTDARQVIASYLIELDYTVSEGGSDEHEDATEIIRRLMSACPGDYIVIEKATGKVMGLAHTGMARLDDEGRIKRVATPSEAFMDGVAQWRLIEPEGETNGE